MSNKGKKQVSNASGRSTFPHRAHHRAQPQGAEVRVAAVLGEVYDVSGGPIFF